MIEQEHAKGILSVADLCEVLEVSPSGYYAGRKREKSPHHQGDEDLGEVIEQYVHSVCKKLTQGKNADYSETEFVRGLTNFMQVVVNIETKYRNKGVKDVQ